MYQGRAARFFRCAYQAKVMKTFDAVSRRVAETTGLMGDVPSGFRNETDLMPLPGTRGVA
jgi:hypothetical protein